MGLLIIGLVAGILIGFGWVAPSQVKLQQCTSLACADRVTAAKPMQPRSTALKLDAPIKKMKLAAAAPKARQRSSVKSGKPTEVARDEHPPTRIRVTASAPPEPQDPVLIKAKASVAAKMEDPGSAQFGDMDRAIRKNTLGRAVDTICGHVRGKNASGSDTGEKPFLYLVKEDDAYVVDGKADSAAAIAYRNICN